jgi:hypothetical protein
MTRPKGAFRLEAFVTAFRSVLYPVTLRTSTTTRSLILVLLLALGAGTPPLASLENRPVVVSVPGGPNQVGRWAAPVRWPVVGIHAIALPTGEVLFYSYPDMGTGFSIPDVDEGSEAMLWNPEANTFRDVSWRRDVF